MSYVKPSSVVETMVEAGACKTKLGVKDILIRGFLSGAILGFATSLAYTATVQTELPIAGALIFPAGFAMIILLGLELVTSNFALVPVAVADRKAGPGKLLYNWALAFLGNLAGSIFYACLFYAVVTKMGHVTDAAIIKKVVSVAEAKTIGYSHLGGEGLMVAFASAVLCNWMVALGAVMSYTATSTTGKIAALWLPILTFFAQGYEHSVVNMFVIPAGMMSGAKVTVPDWWLWNQIPVVIGNMIGGMVFTGLSLYATHGAIKHGAEKNMAKLIDELEKEHSAIFGMLYKIKELGADSKVAQTKLLSIKADLTAHLMKEDKELYPALRKLAENNNKLRDTLEAFTKELEENSSYAIQFLNKYPAESPGADFAREFGRLFAAIKERMSKEEDILNTCKNLKASA